MLTLKSVCLHSRLRNIQLNVNKGEWWMLLGPNGAGKSSLLSVCAGILPCEGDICVNQTALESFSLAQLATFRCLLTQQHHTQFSISVKEAFSFFTSLQKVPDLIEQYLAIAPLLDKQIDQLSGGESQRVHLARSLMQIWPAIESGHALVLLDEPLQQMDIKHQLATLSLCERIQQLGNTLLMSHHDVNHAANYGSHVCTLKLGQVQSAGSIEHVMNVKELESLFEQAFLQIKREGEPSFFVAVDTFKPSS